MNNPEFKRNLWLEFSPQRLLLMPLMLALIAALTIFLSEQDNASSNLHLVFSILGGLLAVGWGSFAVMHSINSEISERTWDQQRLCSLTPWQMAWGKLLGASAYAWYGALLCAAVALVTGLLGPNPIRAVILLVAAILGTLATHCWLMASRLHTMDVHRVESSRTVQRLFGIFMLLQILPVILMAIFQNREDNQLSLWWGIPLGFSSLSLLLAVQALALGLLALWRSMSTQLMVRTTPWAWFTGCAALGFIFAGFADAPRLGWLFPSMICTALVASYFALFTEKNNALVWRTVLYHARHRAWLRCLQALPLWPVSWLLALLVTLLYTAYAGTGSHIASDTANAALSQKMGKVLPSMMWMLLLHALRDAGIYLFFAWRNSTRKPAGMALLTYAVLGYILPLFAGVGSGGLAQLFEPLTGFTLRNLYAETGFFFSSLAWLAMCTHVLIVAALLLWRWRSAVALQQDKASDQN